MLIRSARWGLLFLLLLLTVLWAARSGVPIGFQPPDWALYSLDIYQLNKSDGIADSASKISLSNTASELTIPIPSALNRKPIATELPVISKPSPYGYVFYATSDEYACAVLVNIQRLRQSFHTRHQIHVLVATTLSDGYIVALKSLNAVVTVHEPPPLAQNSSSYYEGCLLKLMAFRMHEIEPSLVRVLVLDSDQLILRSIDSLFELPDVDLAAPRAYWIDKGAVASTFLLIALSDRLWDKVSGGMKSMKKSVCNGDLINLLLADTVLMLPGNYVTLNSHFDDWNIPAWFRPENQKNHLLEDHKKKEDLTDLWQAINILLEATLTASVVGETSTSLSHKRQLGTKSQPRHDPVETDVASNGVESTNLNREILDAKTPSSLQPQPGNDTSTHPSTDERAPVMNGEEDVSINHGIKAPHGDLFNGQDLKITKEETAPPPYPYDSGNHPLRNELYELYKTAYILRFAAVGKPWLFSVRQVKDMKPQAHPALYDSFEIWRQEAKKLCPRIRLQEIPPGEDQFEVGAEEDMWFEMIEEI